MTLEEMKSAMEEVLAPINSRLDIIEKGQKEDGAVEITEEDLANLGTDDVAVVVEVLEKATDEILEEKETIIAESDDEEKSEDEVVEVVLIEDGGLDTNEVIAELSKRRKKRKDAGEELKVVTVEEAKEVIEEVVEKQAKDLDERDIIDMVEDYYEDENRKNDDEPEDGQKRRGGKKSITTSKKPTSKKRQPRANRRSYQKSSNFANVFMQSQNERKSVTLTTEEKIASFGMMSKLHFKSGKMGMLDYDEAEHLIKKHYPNGERYTKSIKSAGATATNPLSSGFLITPDVAETVIEMLYAESLVGKLNFRQEDMPRGVLDIAKQTGSMSSYWVGEAQDIPTSKPEFGMLRLSAKQLASIYFESKQLMLSSTFNSDLRFGRDMLRKMQDGIDLAIFFGKGTEFTPLGLIPREGIRKYTALELHAKDDKLATADGQLLPDSPLWIPALLEDKNVRGGDKAWVMSPMMEFALKRMTNEIGDYIWKEEMNVYGTLAGYKYHVSTFLNEADPKKGALVFGKWDDFIIGNQSGIVTEVSDQASIGQANMFTSNQVATKSTTLIDFAVAHDEAFIVIRDIKLEND